MGITPAYGVGSLKTGVCTSTTRPAVPFEGQTIYETDTDLAKVYNGTAWVGLGGLTLIETLSPSNVATTQFTTGSFNSTYKFYTIKYSLGNTTFTMNLRASGSTITAANYARARTGTNTNQVANNAYSAGDTSFTVLNSASTLTWPANGTINTKSDCTVSGYQVFDSHQVENQYSGATQMIVSLQSMYSANQVYDSLLFTGISGNLTGTIKLYGWS